LLLLKPLVRSAFIIPVPAENLSAACFFVIRDPPSAARHCFANSRQQTANRVGSYFIFYQDDFETPGISPRNANCRKHRRHRPNFRKNARGRPQILQRLCLRVENFGFLASFTRFAVVAKISPNFLL
jgi:hypothetical protein